MPPYYIQGMEAFEKGIKQIACPYHPDSIKGRLWMDGWKDAKSAKDHPSPDQPESNE